MALARPPGGQRLSHLRSIGSWAPVPGVSPVIHFSKAVTLFGRNTRVADYHLNLPATDLNYISRIHARIIRTDGEYILVDSSLTGVYVNDIRIEGEVNLREGDTVTFGHPDGKNVLLGSHTRQPNSPFYFLFEHCDCSPGRMQSAYADGRNFPQPLKGPDLVSAGVSPPGNPNLALAGNVSPPQMALAGVLPGQAPLASSVTQHGPQDALAPPPNPALSASSPLTAEKASEKSSFPSSPRPPLSAPCRRASQVLRSASPDYTLPDENSFAATGSPPESPESGDSVSRSSSSSESTVECDTPPPQGLPPHEAAGSDPEGGCVPPLLPGPTCSEASEAADRDGSPKAAEASGPWEETLQLTPAFPTETESESGCARSVSGPESPALSEAGEEQAQVDLCPSMEDTACLGESFASEAESPVEEMEVAELAGSRAQVRRDSVEEREENLMEKHPAEASFSSAEAEVAEGAESGAVGPSAESQVSELGHIQQHDSAKRTAEIHFPPGEEPMNDSSTQILSQETLDSERRNPLLPSGHSSRGGVDLTVASPQKAAASEAVEMEPPTGEGLEGLDGHLGGRELEPAMSSAIPADAEGVCEKASMVDLCAEVGRRTDGGKPGEMEVAAAESFKALDTSQEPGAEGADSKAWEAREMLLQKQPETLVLGEQSKGRFCQGEKPKDWRGASDTADRNLHSKDQPEPPEGADLLQARPFFGGNKVLAGALETSVPEPPENLGEVISEQGLFQSNRILFEDQGGEGPVMEGKWEPETPRSAESSNNSSEVAADSRLQDGDEASESHDSSLGVTGVAVVGLPGGGPPSYKSGSEGQLQGDSKDPPREEESEWRRSTISPSAAAAAANEDAAKQHREAEGGLEKDPTCLVGQEEAEGSSAAADASLARSPSPEQSFWGSAGRQGDSSRGGLEEGRIPHLGDCSLAGTQLPSLNSQHEAGERSVSESSHLLSCQYVTKDERFTGLNEEGGVKTTMGEEEEEEEGEASPVANAPSAVTKRDLDPSPRQVGSLNGPGSAFSSGSSCVVDLQEPNPNTVEPERLETCLEGASQGADVGGRLLRLEDPLIRDRASEEPEAPVERISLPVPGEPGPDVLLPEERGGSAQMAKAGGSPPGLPLPSVGLLQPGDVAVNLPVEPMDNSDGALQLPDGDDGLRGQVPAPEAEKGEPGQLGPSKTDDLHGGRDASRLDPAEQAANATESREAFREPTEESATRRPADLAVPETRAGPPKGTEMTLEMSPEGQPSSRCDQGSPGRGAASSTAGTEAEEPPHSGKSRKRASEAPVEAGGEEMEPDPVNLAGQPEKPPLDSASEPAEDGRVAWKGFPEDASLDLVQGSGPVAGRLPGQPGTVTVASPLGDAVKGPPAREASSSPQSGKGGYAQKARMVPEDANRLPAPESACRLGKDPEASAGHRGGFGCSEPCEEEKPNRSPPRKRPQNGDLDLEGAACHPKKLFREDLASVRGPGSDPAASPVAPPPPPHLRESVEQFGKTIENFLDQCRNRVPLCSDPTERNGEALAQIVRNYFKSNVDSDAPERGEAEEAPSSETAAAKGIGCQSEGGGAGGPRGSPGGDGPGSPKGEEAEGARISEDAPVSPGGRSAASGSSTKEESKGSGAPGQGGFYYFEEEPFPMEVGSALGDSGCSSPAESLNAALVEGPWEEEWDTPSSLDITASSQSYEPSPSPHWSNSDQALDSCSEGSSCLLETDWYYASDERPGIFLDVAVPWPEDRRLLAIGCSVENWTEEVGLVALPAERTLGAPRRRQLRPIGGGCRPKAALEALLTQAADFRMEIEKFIDSHTDNLREMKGGEFWPIVKCVRIRVATAEVLRTGAVLVDLPGTRDSNAARDTTAREYLKDCSAVWVTASITRAVDDKTAKELLSANFRRQLFMDGLYGSLAFVCTKTDSFSITDIIRDLHLQDQIRPLEEELQELERQRTRAEAEKKHLYDQLQQQQPARKESAAAESAWLQRHDILEKEFQICALQREKEARLRAISLICVQARNEFSKQRILMDFSAGLQEVSRRAEGEEDGEEEVDEGDSAGEQQPVNLEVFTVSSTEYLKLGGKLLCNGQPQVFHDIKDTEIPALKKFAMDTALKHSMVATEKVIRDVARVLSQMVNYLNSQRTEADAHQAQVQEMLQQALQGLPALLQGVLRASAQDLRRAFEALLLGSLQNGAERAKQLSEAIAKGWGSPVVGYPHGAYRAICNHRGVYTSPKYQSVDFNKELAEPILQVISLAWNEVFSSRLASSIEGFTAALLDQLSSFFRGLKKKLHQHRPVAEALHAIHAQQMEAARARLLNFTLDQTTSITRKQRTVSRLLIPTIQAAMEPAYAACSQLSGRGYFQRMKEEMETFVHLQKDAIFDSAVEKMWQQLELFQLSIHRSLQSVAQELATSIRMQFEPLLRPVQKNKEILPELQRLCAKVDKICQRSGVDYVLPTALQPEEQPPKTEAKLPGSGGCVSFPAASMDVRVGALPLPHLVAIQVSGEHITLTLAGEPTQASLPLGSVYRCEVCLPLGCLILRVSAKAAWEVGVQCRVHLPSPGLCSQEALVIREATQDERQLPRLRDCLAARLSAATRVQELSPQQGRETLLSLGVPYLGQQNLESAEPPGPQGASAPEPVAAVGTAGQQPCPLLLPWHPYARKRAGEAVLPQLEKKSKVLPVEPAGYAWLPCGQGAGVKPTSHSAALLGSHSPEGAFRPCPVSVHGRPKSRPWKEAASPSPGGCLGGWESLSASP
ncbi:uncharacterized protein LOC113425142 [Notechis scutatus]|uniref:Uncharacterized protein LOC113425142 n=1 Tax=Notechis scutatus TaxID=8663 RepID=A0A6J1VJ17_9SAUR|nr:uncharacterized protein LOC113425142 [Notechis scutatus]